MACGSFAQLCSGSLGDPVVNITFDNGANNFPPPASYTYVSMDCPHDGSYTITTQTLNCFNSTWHSVTADHTGGGSFMLINASYEPADFFVTTVTGLCPNTSYEFSAWIMNVLKSPAGIKPNLTFRIETTSGTLLNSFNTGDIVVSSQPQWNQYGFYFTTSASNPDVLIRISNNAPGGVGNDLALDDITFRPCGPSVTASISGFNSPVDICVDQPNNYSFTGNVSQGFISPVYQWQSSIDSGKTWTDLPGANNLNYQRTNSPAGKYWYRFTVAENGAIGISSCRIVSNILMINVHPRPFVNAGPDRLVVTGESISLAANVSGEYPSFSWSPPDFLNSDTVLHPVLSPDRDITYRLTATSSYGCSNEDYIFVKVVTGIFVPTAFTPNNDGRNDRWRIPFLDPAKDAAVTVFNRYGQIVYYVKGHEVNWDGTMNGEPQPSGVYVYQVRFTENRPVMKGTFILIR